LDKTATLAGMATDAALATATKADIVLFVVDARAGLHVLDVEWARMVRRASPKIILLANKAEAKKGTANLHEFYKLGLGDPFPVAAEHNIGIVEILSHLKNFKEFIVKNSSANLNSQCLIKIAIMGVPNVGKSTLINKIAGEKRVLVMDHPGVTRDIVRLPVNVMGRDILLLDTAGLRKKARVTDDVETLSALKSLTALDEADVIVLVIDGSGKVDVQAVKIAERVYEAGKILIVALNKWDKLDPELREQRQLYLRREFGRAFSQIIRPVILPISASVGTGVKNMMKRAFELFDVSELRAPTSLINRTVEKLVATKSPPMSRLKRPMKIKFATQTGIHPTRVTINVGGASDIPESYTRYLRRGISKKLGWESIPVVVEYKAQENPFD